MVNRILLKFIFENNIQNKGVFAANEDINTSLPSELKESELVNSESFEVSTNIPSTNGVIIVISTQLGMDETNPIYLNFLMNAYFSHF